MKDLAICPGTGKPGESRRLLVTLTVAVVVSIGCRPVGAGFKRGLFDVPDLDHDEAGGAQEREPEPEPEPMPEPERLPAPDIRDVAEAILSYPQWRGWVSSRGQDAPPPKDLSLLESPGARKLLQTVAPLHKRRYFPNHTTECGPELLDIHWTPTGDSGSDAEGAELFEQNPEETRDVMGKIRSVMAELDCVWWITNGGVLQLGRGTDMTDEDWDVAYICRAANELPYYQCADKRLDCTRQEFAPIAVKLAVAVRKWFPHYTNQDYGMGHMSTQRPSYGMPKLIDWLPYFVLPDGQSVASGFFARPSPSQELSDPATAGAHCAAAYGSETGVLCSRWPIAVVFPLQGCYVEGALVPCPADIARYSSFDVQGAYVQDPREVAPGGGGQRGPGAAIAVQPWSSGLVEGGGAAGQGNLACDGCSACLLWPGGSAELQAAALVEAQVEKMRRLEACGYGHMMSLVSSLVMVKGGFGPGSSYYCGCGVRSRGVECQEAQAAGLTQQFFDGRYSRSGL